LPAYCTDGQVRRAWINLDAGIGFPQLQSLREEVMGEIDATIGNVFSVPFNPWLHVVSVDSNTLTLSLEDAAMIVAGDVVGSYDTSEQAMSSVSATVVSVSGTSVVLDDATGIATNDEIGVVTETDIRGRTVRKAGPPREVEQAAIGLALHLANTRVTDLNEPPPGIVAVYERALAFLGNARRGLAHIAGAERYTVGGLSHEDYAPAFGVDAVDEPWNIEPDPDRIDEIEDDRD